MMSEESDLLLCGGQLCPAAPIIFSLPTPTFAGVVI